jgi:hypothetical protein
MKTILSNGTLMTVLLTTILLTSCIKDIEKDYENVSDIKSDNSTSGRSDSTSGRSNSTSGRSEGYGFRGFILDLGIVDEFRVMQTLILPYNVADGHPMDSTLADMERIQVKFYIKNLFSILPSGEYSFRNTSSISSGTFDSASRTGGYLPDDEIVGGRITVVYNDPNYRFDFDCVLLSGKPFYRSFSGYFSPYDGN